MRLELERTTNVALRVRRAFDQLAELVAIALRRPHVSTALKYNQLRLLAGWIELVFMKDSAMDDEIIAFAEGKITVYRLEHARPFAHVNQLVGLRVPVEMRVVLVRLDVQHRDVLIEQERNAIERRAPAFFYARGEEMPVMQRLIGVGFELHLAHPPHRLHRRRRMDVIQERRRSRKPLVPHQLLGVQSAVGLSERDVPLSRNRAKRVIVRHSMLLKDCRATPAPARSLRTAP